MHNIALHYLGVWCTRDYIMHRYKGKYINTYIKNAIFVFKIMIVYISDP